MKSWAWGAMVMTVFALGACKKSTSSTTSTTSSSSSGTGGDTGAGGSSSSSNSGGGSSTGTNSGGGSSTGTNSGGGSSTGTNSGGGSSTGTNTTGTGGGNPGACDGTGVCQDMDQDPTNDCVTCALQGDCSGQLQACGADADCCNAQADGSCDPNSFVGCINKCAQGDQACQQACAQAHQGGASIYNDLVVCAICEVCPIDCDGPGAGCP